MNDNIFRWLAIILLVLILAFQFIGNDVGRYEHIEANGTLIVFDTKTGKYYSDMTIVDVLKESKDAQEKRNKKKRQNRDSVY